MIYNQDEYNKIHNIVLYSLLLAKMRVKYGGDKLEKMKSKEKTEEKEKLSQQSVKDNIYYSLYSNSRKLQTV